MPPPPISRAFLMGVALAILFGLVVLIFTSPGKPYSVVSGDSEGLSRFANEFKAGWITSLNSLSTDRANRTLLVIARTGRLSRDEVDAIASFMNAGGYVIAYGRRAFLESLAEHMGLNLSFSGRVLDPNFNVGSRYYIVANTTLCDREVGVVVYAPYATTSNLLQGVTVAWSSPLSFVDLNGNGYYDMIEPIGSFPVAVEIRYQRGRLIIVFTELLFENSVMDYNKDFIECVSAGRLVVVDQSETRNDPVEYSKLVLRGPHGAIYMAILVVLLLSVTNYVLQGKQ